MLQRLPLELVFLMKFVLGQNLIKKVQITVINISGKRDGGWGDSCHALSTLSLIIFV